MKADSNLISKWSSNIIEDGYTIVPNLLITHAPQLGLEPSEFMVLIAIEMHRWRPDNAWPSQQRLADITGYSVRSIVRITTSLHDNGLLNKIAREGKPCLYDMAPLVQKLNKLASVSNIAPRKAQL